MTRAARVNHVREPTGRLRIAPPGTEPAVRIGRNVEVRPLGGGLGCLTMIAVSVLVSVLLTVLLNAFR